MAATLLAKRGMNVLVLDDEREDEPRPNLMTGLGSRAFKSLLGKLMIPDSKLAVVHENKTPCQVIFPKNRLDLSTSRPAFLKEIEREFPQEKGIVEELLVEIDQLRETYLEELLSFFPIEGGEKKVFVKWYGRLNDEKVKSLWSQLSPTLQSLIRIQIRFFSRGLLLDPLILQMLLFLPPEGEASFSIRGGQRELKKIFFDKIDYFGGMVHPLGHEPFPIVVKGREVRGVQLSRYNFPTRCRFLLGNTNIQRLYQQIPNPLFAFRLGRTKKKITTLQPVERRSVVQYHLAKEVLPVPMKENLVYVTDPAAPLQETNYLEINLNNLPKGKGDSNGFDTLMTVTYGLPDDPGAEKSERAYEEIDFKLRRLLPFAGESLKRVYPRVEVSSGAEPELFPSEQPPPPENSIVSFSPSLFFPTISSSFKNLFVLGPNLLDWLGMEGKMLSALRAVDLIWTQELKTKKG